jgi:hypothetical protein
LDITPTFEKIGLLRPGSFAPLIITFSPNRDGVQYFQIILNKTDIFGNKKGFVCLDLTYLITYQSLNKKLSTAVQCKNSEFGSLFEIKFSEPLSQVKNIIFYFVSK